MKNILKYIMLVLVFMAGTPAVYAQPANAVKEVIDGKEYYIHTVEKGETIYGIAKKYKITQDAILAANPGSEKGISAGQKLKIPVTGKAENKNDVKQKYDALIKSGDALLEEKKYEEAKKKYEEALNLLPSESLPKQRIARCNELIKAAQTTVQATAEHTVEKGETVYGIAKKYKTTEEKIFELNPEAKKGIAVGQVLKVPVGPVSNSTTTNTNGGNKVVPENIVKDPTVGTSDIVLVEHRVQKGESIYGISKLYQVSEDSLKQFNPSLSEGLKMGAVLIVPTQKKLAESKSWKYYPDLRTLQTAQKENVIAVKKDRYQVALMMPFMLDKNTSFMENRSSTMPAEVYEVTRQTMDFYHGVMLAVDSLKQFGLNIDLTVFDTSRDSARVAKFVNDPAFSTYDLIIGPTENVELVAKAARENQIPMMCPFPYTNKVLLDNGWVSKAITSSSVMVSAASRFVVKHYAKENIIIVDTKRKKDAPVVAAFRKDINRELAEAGRKDTAVLVRSESTSSKTWLDRLRKDQINVLVVPSTDLSYVSSFFNTLQATSLKPAYKDYQFVVVGTDEWLKMDEIENSQKVRFNLHVPSPVYVNFMDTTQTFPFIKAFRAKFGTDPDKYAMMGFDLSYFALAGLMTDGKAFFTQLENYDIEMVHTRFRFRKINENSGYLNSNVYMLRYYDFQLQKVE